MEDLANREACAPLSPDPSRRTDLQLKMAGGVSTDGVEKTGWRILSKITFVCSGREQGVEEAEE